MAVQVDTAPGSPPELTDSRSSKSSSFHSSSLSDGPAGSDLSHFEDITLDDVQDLPNTDSYQECNGAPTTGKRLTPRGSSSSLRRSGSPKAAPTLRDATNVGKSKRANAKPYTNGNAVRELPLHSSGPRSLRRGVTSPSTISLPSGMTHGNRSRSPTPSPTSSSFNVSPRLLPRSSLNIDYPSRLQPRRQSWQPAKTRKTAKELEEEYHDSDEEVPEDAVIWNVPLSPRPPEHRSPSRSPERSSLAPHGGRFDRRHNSFNTRLNEVSRMETKISPHPAPPRSAPAGPEQGDLNLLRHRTKSWTSVLSDLSEDARTLTEALEAFADNKDKTQEEQLQNGELVIPSKSVARASTIELPPLRTGNIMIDPLPISKEKEKLLTRTRPSWLPPKDPKEEKKHLKEYQRMMEYSLQAEKRKISKAEEQQQQRDTTQTSISRIWDQHVLPNWDAVMKEPRTRELWWRGVAPRSRGLVWQKAVGNDLGLSAASYTAALKRAQDHEQRLAKLPAEEREKEHEFAWFEAIRRDVKTTFPELKIFQAGGPLHQTITDVLMAYSMYRSDAGYVHGTHLIAGLLILNLDAPSSFITLANLLNRQLPLAFLINDTPATQRVYDLISETLMYKLPNLHHHLNEVLRLSPDEYLAPLLRTLFCNRLGVDISSRIWDVYVFEGDKTLIRAAVGTLMALESRLYGSKEEVLAILGWAGEEWVVGSEDEFMRGVRDAGKMHVANTVKSPR